MKDPEWWRKFVFSMMTHSGGCANADLDGMRQKREEHRWPLLWWAGWGEPEIEAGKLAN